MTAHITVGGPELIQERRLVTEIPGPRSREILQRKESAVARSVGHTLPIVADAAGGGTLLDVDGNSFIDLGSGIAVTGVGNSNPRVVRAVRDQLDRFTHTAFTLVPYESYIAVAEKLNSITPGSFAKRTALFNSGSEAVENAVKIARRATGRQAIVAFEHSFHGRTNLAMALTAKSAPYKQGFGPFAPEIYRVPGSYPYRDGGLTGPEAARQAIEQIENELGAQSVAAIIIEPIQGEGGFIVPAEGFLPTLREWTERNGIVFIADEIQSGFARTGLWFAVDHEEVVPDLITMAKGIAGGLPLSAVTGRAELMDAAQVGGLGGTYGGNPIACAAALAAIESYEEDGLLDRGRRIGEILTGRLTELQESDPRIGQVRGRGAMIALELVDPDTLSPDPAMTARVVKYAHENGVILLACGTHGNVIRFLPPLTIEDQLLQEGIEIVAEGLARS
ncbi:4-aminobutyrate--2-oxoglutarate transaminase [Arthrobacter bambusae]|uniref:4-aminobutyrate--2-oxoglutarate transaminase n=1 Tax=Arthrobacter bambusae TaxID=1338426 RepID=UPI002785FC18|nr:4-aminobutyrate--2-oxoglutarate transaminase [Arthrobacter bambusae]MDQ0213330.1 4-aminobutyrate aminotransferase/(S)-3-amino-2-methylpropionate transaminase [Arthrobacter bambusae]MDQ0237630.1 4-aminobutyrate aminotransferase/(S)-3-amino-2-methylpropionate transaminase [Arthrobacter bambusae]